MATKAKKTAVPPPPEAAASEQEATALTTQKVRSHSLQVSRMRPVDDDEHFFLPARSHPSDVGLDLTASRYIVVQPGTRALIPHNFKIAFPEGYFGIILPRSSALHIKGLVVQTGTIDPGYRGELRTVIYNPGQKAIHIEPGESLSHLVVLPFVSVTVEQVEKLDEKTDRGVGAFGSTGRVRLPGSAQRDQEEADAR